MSLGPVLLPSLGDMYGSLMVSEHFKDLPRVPAHRDEDDPDTMSAEEALGAGEEPILTAGGERFPTASHMDFNPFISDLGWLSEIGPKSVGLADEQNVVRRVGMRPDKFPEW